MSNAGDKFKELRELFGISRNNMEKLLCIPDRALERIEKQKDKVSFEYVQALLQVFPEFTYWIMLKEIDVEAGQINPYLYKLFFLANEEKEIIFNYKNQSHIDYVKTGLSWNIGEDYVTNKLTKSISEVNNMEQFFKKKTNNY